LRTSNAGVISGTNTSYSRNNLGLPINDLQNTNDSVNVNITDNSTIPIVTRLYLKIDTVLHTNDGDLEFYLEHNGITDTLAYQNGGSGDNFIGTFLNDATNFPLVSGSSPYRGSFKPHRPLSKFNGSNPNGYWKLRIYDRVSGNTGTLQAWSLTITFAQVIGITGNQSVPTEFKLFQNYPNPFNPVTKIKFSVPRGNRQDLSVKLRIYDILGREVTTLINQQMKPGSYIVDWNAGNFASGVYFYRLEVHQAGSSTVDFVESKKMVLVK
jgi:subtilisin-like proprotein convertase family protein